MRAPASASRERRLWLAIALNVAVIALQAAFGFVAHSLGLLADAAHNVSDVAALGVALVAVRLARRAPTSQRSFGMHRAEILAAEVNAVILLVVCGWIGYAAVERLIHPEAVHGGIVVAVAVFAVVANLGAVFVLREAHDHAHGTSNLNMRAAVTHMGADAAASAGVAIAGVVIVATGAWYRLDPAVSLGIALLVAVQAFGLLREAFEVLLEATPPGLDPAELIAAIQAVDGVDDAHDLHVWSLSSDVRSLSAHVMMSGHPTLEEAQVVGVRVKSALASAYGIAHVTLELECESCGEINDRFCAIDRLNAALPRTSGS
jgi:cobalt-zinc-cadmium efflux system protein